VHRGDWRAGAAIYRAWYDTCFEVLRPPSWIRREQAWQELIATDSEDRVFFPFADWPRLAAEAKQYGVTTLAIEGWNAGGNDRGYPDFTPDPRLGTRDEFRQALAELRAMGVRIHLMAEINMADTSAEDFATTWSRFAVENRWGPGRITVGFAPGTIGGRLLHGTGRSLGHPMALLSPAHREFREHTVQMFVELARDGVDGLQLDKAGDAAVLDFNTSLPTSPDRSLPQGYLDVLDELLRAARSVHPDFAVLYGATDRAFPYADAAHWAGGSHVAVEVRYTFPEWSGGVCVEDPEAFDEVNVGLRYGLMWWIAPRRYTAGMDEELSRPISRYIAELIRIRAQWKELLFYGRCCDTAGARVAGGSERTGYSVFEPLGDADQRRAVVVVNFGEAAETLEVSIVGKDGGDAAVSAPFAEDRVSTLPVTLTVEPQRAAVIVG
jgi:hypothetical protein